MNQKYRNIIMWALFALLFLAAVLAQTTLFGRVRFYDVKLSLLPIAVVCIGMRVDHEAAGLFGLAAALGGQLYLSGQLAGVGVLIQQAAVSVGLEQ